MSCCDPDIEIVSGRVLIGTSTYRGHGGMEQLFRGMAVAWEELRGEVRDVVAVGCDELVVVGETSGKGKTAGAPFAAHIAAHVRFTHRKVVRFEWFATKEEALEAAGLRE